MIALLLCIIIGLSIRVALYEGDLKVIRSETNLDLTRLKEQNEALGATLESFKEVFARAQVITKGGLFSLPPGALVIFPPQPEEGGSNEKMDS